MALDDRAKLAELNACIFSMGQRISLWPIAGHCTVQSEADQSLGSQLYSPLGLTYAQSTYPQKGINTGTTKYY